MRVSSFEETTGWPCTTSPEGATPTYRFTSRWALFRNRGLGRSEGSRRANCRANTPLGKISKREGADPVQFRRNGLTTNPVMVGSAVLPTLTGHTPLSCGYRGTRRAFPKVGRVPALRRCTRAEQVTIRSIQARLHRLPIESCFKRFPSTGAHRLRFRGREHKCFQGPLETHSVAVRHDCPAAYLPHDICGRNTI